MSLLAFFVLQENNAALKAEITSCKGMSLQQRNISGHMCMEFSIHIPHYAVAIDERNQLLNLLQHHLDEIKFEKYASVTTSILLYIRLYITFILCLYSKRMAAISSVHCKYETGQYCVCLTRHQQQHLVV